MKHLILLTILTGILILSAGCHYDIVTTRQIKAIEHKCVYIAPLQTSDPAIGQVLRDVLTKEFLRKKFEFCNQETATILITGSAFLTERSDSKDDWLGGKSASSQAIESVSLVVQDREETVIASASYDNTPRHTASKLAKELGGALAGKMR